MAKGYRNSGKTHRTRGTLKHTIPKGNRSILCINRNRGGTREAQFAKLSAAEKARALFSQPKEIN